MHSIYRFFTHYSTNYGLIIEEDLESWRKMALLLLAALFIVIGCFCLVFGLDKKRPAKTRKYLLYTALICVFVVWGLATAIMLHPLK